MIRASLLGSVVSVQALLIVCVLVESRAFAPPRPQTPAPSPKITIADIYPVPNANSDSNSVLNCP